MIPVCCCGAKALPVRFLYTTYGPCSTNRPNMEVPPGPPCSQSRTGASSWAPCKEYNKNKVNSSAPSRGEQVYNSCKPGFYCEYQSNNRLFRVLNNEKSAHTNSFRLKAQVVVVVEESHPRNMLKALTGHTTFSWKTLACEASSDELLFKECWFLNYLFVFCFSTSGILTSKIYIQ